MSVLHLSDAELKAIAMKEFNARLRQEGYSRTDQADINLRKKKRGLKNCV
jgi:hypothetical protein